MKKMWNFLLTIKWIFGNIFAVVPERASENDIEKKFWKKLKKELTYVDESGIIIHVVLQKATTDCQIKKFLKKVLDFGLIIWYITYAPRKRCRNDLWKLSKTSIYL